MKKNLLISLLASLWMPVVFASSVELQSSTALGQSMNPNPASLGGVGSIPASNPRTTVVGPNGSVLNSVASSTVITQSLDKSDVAPAAWAQTAYQNPTSIRLLPFAANLFSGRFASTFSDGVSPDYVMAPGDRVVIRVWGARTYDDVLISGFEIYPSIFDNVSTYDPNQIIAIDWASYGTDTRVKFCTEKTKTSISSQDTLRTILLENSENKYILYDHGTGEIADYIAIQEEETRLIVRLYHVKKKSSVGYNSSTGDVYEVAGQAVKSITWLTTKGKFIEKISDRHRGGHCQLLNGEYDEFIRELRGTTKQIVGYIVIVQPALSRTVPMPDKIQEILAAASSYISRAGKVRGLEIFGSE